MSVEEAHRHLPGHFTECRSVHYENFFDVTILAWSYQSTKQNARSNDSRTFLSIRFRSSTIPSNEFGYASNLVVTEQEDDQTLLLFYCVQFERRNAYASSRKMRSWCLTVDNRFAESSRRRKSAIRAFPLPGRKSMMRIVRPSTGSTPAQLFRRCLLHTWTGSDRIEFVRENLALIRLR